MRHFTHIRDLGPEGVAALINRAQKWKRGDPGAVLAAKALGMVFFNPSLRTRTSFEMAMLRSGGHAIALDIGNGVWKLEDRDGAVMNGDRAEHVRDAVPVLGRYVDLLGVRSFSHGGGIDEDDVDAVIAAFRRFSSVPVISMESAREHPCQGLADLMTVQESLGDTRGMPVCLSWAPHIKPLPRAVPNSFLLTAAAMGCEVRLAHPPGYDLAPSVLDEAKNYAKASGGSINVVHDQREALRGVRVLCAKAWGPLSTLGPGVDDPALADWMPRPAHLADAAADAVFLHCLPVRRNVEISDALLDSAVSRVTDEAENRLHIQRAALHWLLHGLDSD